MARKFWQEVGIGLRSNEPIIPKGKKLEVACGFVVVAAFFLFGTLILFPYDARGFFPRKARRNGSGRR